jgi:protein-S-isoprenylcysteine O-methyltransferase Ste14
MTVDMVFKIVYLLGLIVESAIRVPLNQQRRRIQVTTDRFGGQEKAVLGLLLFGVFLFPVAYIFTPWLDFANYRLPDWAGWLGATLFAGALVIYARTHYDLGRNWTPTLHILEGHQLVTQGIYRYVRHPMYASQWLWSIAQILLLQNWVAGLAGLVTFIPLYFLRVPKEEEMMIDHFGEAYRAYRQRTGRVIPRLGR